MPALFKEFESYIAADREMDQAAISISIEMDLTYHDLSFDHEFGTERDYDIEVEEVKIIEAFNMEYGFENAPVNQKAPEFKMVVDSFVEGLSRSELEEAWND